jgi:hypothetical protein
MRTLTRSLVLTGALLVIAAAGSAAWRYVENGPHPIVKEQTTNAVLSTGGATGGVSTPLYAKPRCDTIKPFKCRPKRTESPA